MLVVYILWLVADVRIYELVLRQINIYRHWLKYLKHKNSFFICSLFMWTSESVQADRWNDPAGQLLAPFASYYVVSVFVERYHDGLSHISLCIHYFTVLILMFASNLICSEKTWILSLLWSCSVLITKPPSVGHMHQDSGSELQHTDTLQNRHALKNLLSNFT